MSRQEDYANAWKLAAEELKRKHPGEIAHLSDSVYSGADSNLELMFIGRLHRVSWPDLTVAYADSDQEVPLTEQVLILHYLNEAKGTPLRNELITYREVPAGDFYYPAFVKRAEVPMLSAFGSEPKRLLEVAPWIGAEPVPGQGDASVLVPALPRVPVTLVVWGQ